MARNEEKHYCRLNRVLLQQEKEELERKNPKRPKLDTLTSATEIKQWIPSIKRDLEFCLAQSQVPCYSESKIADFQSDIQKLECEFKAFVHKTKQLEPEINAIPWTNRPYKSKNEDSDNTAKVNLEKDEAFVPIRTPILDGTLPSIKHEKITDTKLVNVELIDKPLAFHAQKFDNYSVIEETEYLTSEKDQNIETKGQYGENRENSQDERRYSGDLSANLCIPNRQQRSLVGVDYDSSDSEPEYYQ